MLMWLLRHLFAIVVLPVMVAIFIPLWIARRTSLNWPADAFGWLWVALGAVLIAAGLALFAVTLYLFATRGRGTLAPWDPPAHLVVDGPYRYVRNPMIAGVLIVLAGEALVLRSPAHGEWALLFLLINAIYFPLLEEPLLEERFGEDYRDYKRHVRRFLPRLRPWNPQAVLPDAAPPR
jgi:protein-S-isoprenylcysteine O-methyltransferase Ste14